jgi:hypothetical protein
LNGRSRDLGSGGEGGWTLGNSFGGMIGLLSSLFPARVRGLIACLARRGCCLSVFLGSLGGILGIGRIAPDAVGPIGLCFWICFLKPVFFGFRFRLNPFAGFARVICAWPGYPAAFCRGNNWSIAFGQ